MTLTDALGVTPGDVVAFIGGGGKTTAIYRAAEEMGARGRKVIVTTTTKIFPPDRADFALLLEARGGEVLASRVREALGNKAVVVVAARALPDGKLQGVGPEEVVALRAVRDVAAVLVEADGSARKPFKAPAPHEPVIPEATTLLVVVVGADVLGAPLTGDLVHRPDLAAQQGGIALGDALTPQVVARILLGPANLCGKPAGARLAALIARAGTPVARESVHRLASLLLAGGASPVVAAELVADPQFVAVVPDS